MHSTFFRGCCLLLLSMVTFWLGLIRYDYVLNLVNANAPLLIPRTLAEQASYPVHLSEVYTSMVNDPRWLSGLIFLTYPAAATLMAVYLIFHKKAYSQITVMFYGTGFLLMLLLILISLLFHRYDWGYGIAQHIKKIYQEPYASLLLLGSFYWNQRRNETST